MLAQFWYIGAYVCMLCPQMISCHLRKAQISAGGVASVCRSWVQSPPSPRWLIGSFVGYYAFLCAKAPKLKKQQICKSPAPGRNSKLTHKGVEMDTCAFQTGCQLSSAASGMSLRLCCSKQFQRHEANVLDNWQLAVLPQSGGREFNPHWVHDNSFMDLCAFPCTKASNLENNKYVRNMIFMQETSFESYHQILFKKLRMF